MALEQAKAAEQTQRGASRRIRLLESRCKNFCPCIYGKTIGVLAEEVTGEYSMDFFTDKHAIAMMQHCKTILRPKLADPDASHLLAVPVAELQAFISTAEWTAKPPKRTDTILDWALLLLAGAAGSRF